MVSTGYLAHFDRDWFGINYSSSRAAGLWEREPSLQQRDDYRQLGMAGGISLSASVEVHQKELRLGSQATSAADMSWNARRGFNREGRTIQSIFSVILTE
ncbi:hypothetical protein AV530_005855 [Patagioenas fasciata monilis]|uniref:Uncharacterized protein n=1 Tax=Patagioenas fasciata monilis TaxID=372326 RepID=A0A1V4JMW6_PATFA|nr:hypothetical protein AV530_005855 [Patagioenas fasciata monilis]